MAVRMGSRQRMGRACGLRAALASAAIIALTAASMAGTPETAFVVDLLPPSPTWQRLAQAPAPAPASTDVNSAGALRDQIRQAIRLYQTGRCVDAIPVAKAAADAIRANLGANHPDLVAALNIRALCHKALGQYQEAEPLYRAAVEAAERISGSESTETGIMIDNLAGLYFEQQLLEQAEPLRRRALEIFQKTTGQESRNTLISTQNLAALLFAKGQHVEAERLFRRAMTIAEKVYSPDDPQQARLLDNLAGAVRSQGRLAEAAPLYERSIAIFVASLGPEHPDTAVALQNHAILLSEAGQYAASEAQLQRALQINTKNFGSTHPALVIALNTMANGYIDQGRWSDAVTALRRGADILATRRTMATDDGRGSSRTEQQRYAITYRKLVQSLLHASPGDTAALDEAFRIAQIALGSEASIAVTQMAARFATSDPKIAGFLRERQDLVGEAELRDQQLIAAAGRRTDARNPSQEQASRDRIAAIQIRLHAIDAVLARDFPGYAALADPKPLAIKDVQQVLLPGEVLILTLNVPQIGRSPNESYVIAVTKDVARAATVPLGDLALDQAVRALRCSLDAANWETPACVRLLAGAPPKGPLPFDLVRAHNLYKALFGNIEDLVAERHILFVPAGPLTKLPPHVLVTKQPNPNANDGDRYRQASWLARRQPISILPSVASLQGLRGLAKSSRAVSPMIGFGNPLLTGPDGTDRTAWAKSSCADASPVRSRLSPQVVAQAPIAGSIVRNTLANIETVRRQSPLPETADELCAVARSIGADDASIKLGAKATETAVKELSRAGELSRHAIVHFATHGLVAGDLPNLAEPALMLTPPDRASSEDDGLLTASEITQLKLNADWVIMSACNTAAGAATHANALSGLARSFFYAGARSLLVSHWAVNSDTTVQLITAAVDGMKTDPTIGRAEALRRAMLAMIDHGPTSKSHPSAWAPFVLVGEGAGSSPLVTGTIRPAESRKSPAVAPTVVPPTVTATPPLRSTSSPKPKPTSKRFNRQQAEPKAAPQDWSSRIFRDN